MPGRGMAKIRVGASRAALMLVTLGLLSACVGSEGGLNVTKMGFGKGTAPAEPVRDQLSAPHLTQKGEVRSDLIADLQSHRSILPASGPYATVASAVTEAGAGVAAAELRIARLRAEARSKNWLPSIGPQVNLSSLGALAASILVEQALFDNGRRKAERAHAAADVEVAAVTLSIEANKRVYEGLKHYITSQKAREQAAVTERGIHRLAEFDRIMAIRVEGGLADRSEQSVLTQRLAEMRAMQAADLQAEVSAMAELSAMTTRSLADVNGLQALPSDTASPQPVSVLKARAEGARAIAEADMAKASMMPSLGAQVGLGKGGVDAGLVAGGGNIGFGSRAEREALNATGDLVGRRTAQAAEDANRRIVSLQRELDQVAARQREGAEVLRQTESNLSLFSEQYRVGRRSLLELVQQYESFTRAERDQVALTYIAADLRLQIALERGVLVDGADL